MLMPLPGEAADATSAAPVDLAVHLAPVALNANGVTPWDLNPLWFVLIGVGLPAVMWTGLAWTRVLEEDPHRLRRAALRNLRRLVARMRTAGGTPRPADLHAWLQAAAQTWGVRVATPTAGQVGRSMDAHGSDPATQSRWAELWKSAERVLYAAGFTLPPAWLRDTAAVVNEVQIPPRLHWLPTRRRHWLPPQITGWLVCALLASLCVGSRAAQDGAAAAAQSPQDDAKPARALDVKVDGRAAAALRSAQAPAARALRADWNNWGAHYNVATQQMIQGNVDYAVAHLTAALLQHPTSGAVQDNLRWSLQQAGSMDPTVKRLLYGAWFQRYPVLLSPAGWQRLGLMAGLLIGAGACAGVLQIYVSRNDSLRRMSRGLLAAGVLFLTISVSAWNGWGDLHRPNAAMLVEDINLSPAPTDLVKDRETLPMTSGSLALSQATFLGWKEVQLVGLPGGRVTGWVRSRYVMPLYATP